MDIIDVKADTTDEVTNKNRGNITDHVVRGLSWSFLSVIITSFLQLIFAVVMARLLDPAIYGLAAMANIILGFGSYFAKMGTGPALIQKQTITNDDISAGFVISIIFGLLVSLIVFSLAPLARLIFNNDAVVTILRVSAFSLFIGSTSITSTSCLRRSFDFKSLAIAEIASFAIGAGVVGITMAYLGFGVWSLVVSSMVEGFVLSVVAFGFSRHPIKPLFNLKVYKSILNYGSRFSLNSFLEYLNYNIDSLSIGRIFGSDLLGLYNRAGYIVKLPAYQVSSTLLKVLFPTFSKIQLELSKLRQTYLGSITILGMVLFAFSFAVSAASNEIILVIFGNKWLEAIPILRLIALATPYNLLLTVNCSVLDSIAKLNLRLILISLRLVVLFSLYLLFLKFGLLGFTLAYVVTEVVYYFSSTLFLKSTLGISTHEFLQTNLIILGSGLLEMIIISLITFILQGLAVNSLIILIVQIFVAGLILLYITIVNPPKIVKSFVLDKLIWSYPPNSNHNPIVNWIYRFYRP